MARKKLTLVHTSATLVPVFEQLCKEKNLEVDLVHIEDSSLIKDIIADGELTAKTTQRVMQRISDAHDTAADYIMVTCSSIGPAVDAAQAKSRKPLFRVDQPLADHAVKLGRKIGVLATLVTTMAPTTELIKRRASHYNKEVEIVTDLCNGAFDYFIRGELNKYDAAINEAVTKMAQDVDVIVLAQASMANAVTKLDVDKLGVPVLSSPSLAIDYIASIL